MSPLTKPVGRQHPRSMLRKMMRSRGIPGRAMATEWAAYQRRRGRFIGSSMLGFLKKIRLGQ